MHREKGQSIANAKQVLPIHGHREHASGFFANTQFYGLTNEVVDALDAIDGKQ